VWTRLLTKVRSLVLADLPICIESEETDSSQVCA